MTCCALCCMQAMAKNKSKKLGQRLSLLDWVVASGYIPAAAHEAFIKHQNYCLVGVCLHSTNHAAISLCLLRLVKYIQQLIESFVTWCKENNLRLNMKLTWPLPSIHNYLISLSPLPWEPKLKKFPTEIPLISYLQDLDRHVAKVTLTLTSDHLYLIISSLGPSEPLCQIWSNSLTVFLLMSHVTSMGPTAGKQRLWPWLSTVHRHVTSYFASEKRPIFFSWSECVAVSVKLLLFINMLWNVIHKLKQVNVTSQFLASE